MCEVHGSDRLDGLQFDDQEIADDEVDTMQANVSTTIPHSDPNLTSERNASFLQLDAQGFLVNRLQVAGAELTMNRERGIHDQASESVSFRGRLVHALLIGRSRTMLRGPERNCFHAFFLRPAWSRASARATRLGPLA